MSTRVVQARSQIAKTSKRSSREQRVHAFFAWIDLFVICGALIAATIYAILAE